MTPYLLGILFVCLSVCVCVCLSAHPSNHPSIHPSVYLLRRLLYIHLPVRQSVCLFLGFPSPSLFFSFFLPSPSSSSSFISTFFFDSRSPLFRGLRSVSSNQTLSTKHRTRDKDIPEHRLFINHKSGSHPSFFHSHSLSSSLSSSFALCFVSFLPSFSTPIKDGSCKCQKISVIVLSLLNIFTATIVPSSPGVIFCFVLPIHPSCPIAYSTIFPSV